MSKINRREFVVGSIGIGGLLASTRISDLVFASARGGVTYDSLDPTKAANFKSPLLLPSNNGLYGLLQPSSNLTFSVRQTSTELISGTGANLWAYQVETAGKTYFNPILRVNTGARLNIMLRDDFFESTLIHWHGLRVDWKNDGHPSYEIGPGGTYQYDFSVPNRSGNYWYHPHAHMRTGEQIYYGLASLLIVEDDDELNLQRSLDLTLGETDIPLILQDRRFGEGGLAYNVSLEEEMVGGYLGDVVTVNLTPTPTLDVDTRIYRFRMLNASNARTYRLAALRDTEPLPFHIVGNDGGLLDKPYQVTQVFLSPGERVDVLLDLRRLQAGDVVFWGSQESNPMHNEHSGERHGDDPPPRPLRVLDGASFYLLKLNVKRRVTYDRQVPARLSQIIPINISKAGAPRRFSFVAPDLEQGQHDWGINGITFKMDDFPVSVKKDSIEIWEMVNKSMSMPHPMHLHGVPFQVLERIGSPNQIKDMVVDNNGLLPTDKGWKDTVLVWPGETIRVAVDFSHNFAGEQIYMYHCHILEHQDMGMMINYKVV